MQRPGGKLVIHVEEAVLKRDTETFGTMDPYCSIHFNGKTHKTATKTDAGKHPKWNYRLELEVSDVMDNIDFKVYDHNTFSDSQIAHTTGLKIFTICGPNNGMTEDHHLFYEKKDRGTIKIRTQYTPFNAAPAPGQGGAAA